MKIAQKVFITIVVILLLVSGCGVDVPDNPRDYPLLNDDCVSGQEFEYISPWEWLLDFIAPVIADAITVLNHSLSRVVAIEDVQPTPQEKESSASSGNRSSSDSETGSEGNSDSTDGESEQKPPAQNPPQASVEIITLLNGTDLATDLYIICSGVQGRTLLVVGGTHGDEPAGFLAARGISQWSVSQGRLLVIPTVNEAAIAAGTRRAPGGEDLNRSYPGDPEGTDTERLAAAVFAVMEEFKPDWVLDLHESLDFYRVNPKRVGQTLIVYPDGYALLAADDIIYSLNQFIEGYKEQFSLLQGPVEGSTAYAAGHYIGAVGITVETAVKQDLSERVFQQLLVVDLTLSYLGMHSGHSITELRSQAQGLCE